MYLWTPFMKTSIEYIVRLVRARVQILQSSWQCLREIAARVLPWWEAWPRGLHLWCKTERKRDKAERREDRHDRWNLRRRDNKTGWDSEADINVTHSISARLIARASYVAGRINLVHSRPHKTWSKPTSTRWRKWKSRNGKCCILCFLVISCASFTSLIWCRVLPCVMFHSFILDSFINLATILLFLCLCQCKHRIDFVFVQCFCLETPDVLGIVVTYCCYVCA